jgi:hypothetical protein
MMKNSPKLSLLISGHKLIGYFIKRLSNNIKDGKIHKASGQRQTRPPQRNVILEGGIVLATEITCAQVCLSQEEVKEFDYMYTPLFRVVPPYRFEFGTSIKERWIGRPLVEIFAQEFPYFEDSLSYYKEAMTLGRLRVNDEVTPLEYRCRDGDVITHIVHRCIFSPGTKIAACIPSPSQ